MKSYQSPNEDEPDNRLLDMIELEDDEEKNSITKIDDDHSIIEPDDSEPVSPNMDITDRRYEDDTTNHNEPQKDKYNKNEQNFIE
jgi:hypothetical protein